MVTLADVIAPQNEEGTKATILKWCKAVGDGIREDEPLLELETDKVTVEIPSPASGILVEILKQPNEDVLPGQLLARVRTDTDAGEQQGAATDAGGSPVLKTVPVAAASSAAGPAAGPSAGPSAEEDGRRLLSPAVRRLLSENSLTAANPARCE